MIPSIQGAPTQRTQPPRPGGMGAPAPRPFGPPAVGGGGMARPGFAQLPNPGGAGMAPGGNPAPRPMMPSMGTGAGFYGRPASPAPRPMPSVGGMGGMGGMHSPTSAAGMRATPYERYVASGPDNRMNLQEFRNSGQVQDYGPQAMLAQLDPRMQEIVKRKLLERMMGGAPRAFGSDFAPRFGGLGDGGGALGGGAVDYGPRPTRTYELPMPSWAHGNTMPAPQPMPPQVMGGGFRDPRMSQAIY